MDREIPAPRGGYPFGRGWNDLSEADEQTDQHEVEDKADGLVLESWDDDPLFGFDDDDDGDDLLAALDEALDEVEAEARIELARSLACPQFDALELFPFADTAYRSAIAGFMGVRRGLRAPRYSQLIRANTVHNPELSALLQYNLQRSRAFVERRRAEKCWVT